MNAMQPEQIDAIKRWEEITSYWNEGGDLTYGFLQLAKSNLEVITNQVGCEYCRKQIEAEVRLLDIALQFSLLANEWKIATSVEDKLGLIRRAVPLIARVGVLEIMKIF